MPRFIRRLAQKIGSAVAALLLICITVGAATEPAAASAAGSHLAEGAADARSRETKTLLTPWPPTNVFVSTTESGFTVYGHPECSFDFASCRAHIVIPGAGIDIDKVQTSNGYFVPWPSSWAPGTSVSGGRLHSRGQNIFGFWYFDRSGTSLGTITRPPQRRALTAAVTSTDATKRSAVISGTATAGADIRRPYTTRVATASGTGSWSEKVQNLPYGTTSLTYYQYVNGTFVDQKTVSVTLVDPTPPPATDIIAPAGSDKVVLEQGRSGKAFATFSAKQAFYRFTGGTITFTAPQGTRFTAGQDAQRGQYQNGPGSWSDFGGNTLTNGQLSDGGRRYTFDLVNRGSDLAKDQRFRFGLDLAADGNAALGSRDMTAKLTGTADSGTFDTTASTAVEVTASDVVEGAITVPPIRQGGTSSVTEFTFDGNPFGTGHFTAPTGTTIASIENINGEGTVTAGTIAADGKTATIGSDGWAWGSPVKLRVTLRADQNAPVGSVSDGVFETRLGTVVTATATVSTTIQSAVGNGGVIPAPGGRTELVRGGSVRVPFGLEARARYDAISGDVTLTAPNGSTFDAGQTVTAEWFDGAGWHADTGLALRDVAISNGGKTLTGKIPSEGFGLQNPNWQLRWNVAVTAGATAAGGDGELGFVITGTTSVGAFSVSGATPTTLPALPAAPLVITSPADGDTVQSSSMRVAFSGTGEPGAHVVIRTQTSTPRVIVDTWVQNDRTWSALGAALNFDVDYTLDTIYTIPGQAPVTGVHHVTVVNSAPGVTKPFAFTTPAEYSTVIAPDKRVRLAGEATTGTIVQIWNWDKKDRLIGTAIADPEGKWQIPSAVLDNQDRRYELHVEYTEPGKQVEELTHVITVKAEDSTTLPFTVGTPASGSTVQLEHYRQQDNNGEAVVSGTGQTGGRVKVWNFTSKDRIVIKDEEVLTVDRNGNWSGTGEFAAGMPYAISVEYFAPGADLDGDPTEKLSRPFTTAAGTR